MAYWHFSFSWWRKFKSWHLLQLNIGMKLWDCPCLFSKCIFQLRSNDPNMTYFHQLAVLWNLQNCPPCHQLFHHMQPQKGIRTNTSFIHNPRSILPNPLKIVYISNYFNSRDPTANNKLYSIIGSIRIHQEPKIWNHKLVNFPVRQRKKCRGLM